MTLGRDIRSLRKARGLTLESLAETVGVSNATVSRWETGEIKNIRSDKLGPLADALGVSVDYLLGNDVSHGAGASLGKIQERIIDAVLLERKRQDTKWGEQNHPPHYWTGILGEEYGELCEAINETIFDNGSDKGGYENMRTEAIHVAAVAIGFLECLERNKALWFPSPAQGDRCVSCGEYVPEGRMVCQVCEDDPSHALRKAGEREVTGRYGVCRGKIQETL